MQFSRICISDIQNNICNSEENVKQLSNIKCHPRPITAIRKYYICHMLHLVPVWFSKHELNDLSIEIMIKKCKQTFNVPDW